MNNHRQILNHSSLLQNFQSLELHSPYHLPDTQPFSFELRTYTGRIRTIALVFFILGIIAISTTGSFQLWQLQPSITAENALLELVQGLLLLLAASMQALRAFTTTGSTLERDIRSGLALFAFLLLLREVDIDKLGLSTHWALVEQALRGLALLFTIGFAVHLVGRKQLIIQNLSAILGSPTVLISLLSCMFYASGWPFDKELFHLDKALSLWFEETLELNACLLLLCASFTGGVRSAAVKLNTSSF